MRSLAKLLAASLAIPCTADAAAPADLETMQQCLDQLETLVGTLRTELDAERTARQRVEAKPGYDRSPTARA